MSNTQKSVYKKWALCKKHNAHWLFGMDCNAYFALKPFSFNAACAAAKRATGTRKGEQLT